MSCQGVLTHLVTDVNMYRLSRNPQMHLFATKSWNKPISEHLCICLQSCLLLVNTVCEHHWIFYLNWHLDWQTDQDNNIKDEACHFCIKPNCKTNMRLTESFSKRSACQTESPAPKLTWLAESEFDMSSDTNKQINVCHNVSLFRKPNNQQLANNLCFIISSAFTANAPRQKNTTES